MPHRKHPVLIAFLFGLLLGWAAPAPAQYIKSPPDQPTDVDKLDHGDQAPVLKPTCWLATAANMLAGAGYGNDYDGDAQYRADQIYERLKSHFGDSD